MAEPFIGEIRIFPYSFAPLGWAYCDGGILSIRDNSALYAVLGSRWGGDGQNSFALPDLRARAPMHAGRGSGLTPRGLTEKVGTDSEVLNASMLPKHSHRVKGYVLPGEQTEPTDRYIANVKLVKEYKKIPYTAVAMASSMVGDSGESAYHSNLQPYLTLAFCIALEGFFPSRS
ncbi:phage tail protein [Celerinatantimonas yamalensis]|uniref:Tail fiber protein n=1 Tax=Celerinatantimonas yamalensis TaxID=559956 RepID=A0ABW9G988_9GAMM